MPGMICEIGVVRAAAAATCPGPLRPGDHYALGPPHDDVHRVRTTSERTSVSIHLLANDTGCTVRHTFHDVTGEATDFRSGYANAECATATA